MDAFFWLELLARSTALLVVAELIFRMNKSDSPALKHRLLLWTFIGLALLPILAMFIPDIPFALWRPKAADRALVTVVEVAGRTVRVTRRSSIDWFLLSWIAGVVISCLPVLVGTLSIWRISRRAKRINNEILITDELSVPMTFGIVRPRILLPSESEHWSASRLQAVLSHERAHMRRRDVAVQIGAHLIAALWWFQPLVWVAKRKLRLQSEFACDAEVIRSGLRPSDYAAELLAIAKNADRHWRMRGASLAMVRASNLEERVRALLRPPLLARSPKIYVLGLALASAAIAASAVSFQPQQSFHEPGGSHMKRVILSALLTSAGLSAATVNGVVHDSNGGGIADAKVTLTNPDATTKEESVTAPDGRFQFSGGGPGQYILRIEKPGFVSIFREFDLKADSNMEREFTMPAEGSPAVADTLATGGEGQPKNIRVGGQVAESNLIRKVQPTYPMAAKAERTQGTVELEVAISQDGVPTEIQVVRSPSDDLSASALEAVRQWRYRPTLLNGNPVSILTSVIVHYTLSR